MYFREVAFILCIKALVAISIVWYSTYRCSNPDFKDPLVTKFGESGIADGWSASHFLLNAFIGFCCPHFSSFVLATILGMTWEALEYIVQTGDANARSGLSGAVKPWLVYMRGLSECQEGDEDEGWWYAKPSDLFMNATGFLSGSALRMFATKKKCELGEEKR